MPIDVKRDNLQTALNKLKARETSFRLLEKLNNLGSWEVDLKTKKSIWSENSYKLYGYEPFSFEPTIDVFFKHLVPKYLEQAKETYHRILSSHKIETFQAQIQTVSGNIIDILLTAQVIYDDKQHSYKLIGSTQDISARIKLEQKSKELSALVENSSNEIYIVDCETDNFLFVNKGACSALGYTKEELLQLNIYDINLDLSHKQVTKIKKKYNKQKNNYAHYDTIHKRKDDTSYHVHSYIQRILFNSKRAYVLFDTDVTQEIENHKLLEEKKEELFHQAHHDSLTNLPNRTLFRDRLEQAIRSSARNNTKFALLFIDLDHFKDINDSLGHHIGDEVLKKASKRLLQSIRDEDTLARLGGDEFTIILQELSNIDDISNITEKILAVLRKPLQIFSHELDIRASIGVAVYPENAIEANSLIKSADAAMYKAKERGRDCYEFYSTEMTTNAFERMVMKDNLRIAIKEKQFVVYYQPQVNPITDKIVGMEALVRWNHPIKGLVPPLEFIPIAEKLGLIVAIDRLTMDVAMQQFSAWHRQGLNPGKLSLNLTMQQLNETDFIKYLTKLLTIHQFKNEWLELEITETQVMKNPQSSIPKLTEIAKHGIDIAIDDFGTGYSSLSYLTKLPLTKLKIDQSFVREIPNNKDDIAIVQAILAMSKSLKLTTIAEGVETVEQKEFLVKNGCKLIQGYFYSKPVPAEDIGKLLEKN
jgi:diguanylate cyclase (GGDEF)-like protein/PAS domain S-box-containing protein